jgi:hypothetical protein
MKTFIRKSLTPSVPDSSLPEEMIADAKEIYTKMGKYAIEESMLLVRVPIDSVENQLILDYEAKYLEYFQNKQRVYHLEKEFTQRECDEAEYLILWVGNLTYPADDEIIEFCCVKRCYNHDFKYSVPYRIEGKSLGKKHLGNMTDGGFVVSIAMRDELEKHNFYSNT